MPFLCGTAPVERPDQLSLEIPLSIPGVRCGGGLEQTTIFRLRTLLATCLLSKAWKKMSDDPVQSMYCRDELGDDPAATTVLPPLWWQLAMQMQTWTAARAGCNVLESVCKAT